MSRVQWQAESRALGLVQEARQLSTKLQVAEARAEAAESLLDGLREAPWYRRIRGP